MVAEGSDGDQVEALHEMGASGYVLKDAAVVETREGWMLLSDLVCGEVQDYFIAKPMPGDALVAW